MPAMGETKSDFGFGGWGCVFPDPSLAYDGRIGFTIFLVTFRPIPCCKGCMNTETNQTLDIQGTINGYRKAAFWKVGLAVPSGSLAVILWPAGGGDSDDYGASVMCLIFSFVSAAFLAFGKETYIYLDFADRQIVTVDRFAWWETSKRRSPLTDFSNIVVRHLCHPGGEEGDTYTGSVGLKPVDGRAVLWVKSFPTTQDEVPRATHKFAMKLQEMTGLPVETTAEFNNETHKN